MGDLRFAHVDVVVGPTEVVVSAADGTVAGATASDLRKCIDNSNCPDSRLALASRGNGDGQVTEDEVTLFEDNAIAGLNAALAFGGSGGLADFGRQLRELVRIDDQGPTGVHIETIDLSRAAGRISDTATISVTFVMKVLFDTAKKDRHDVSVTRTTAELDLAERISVHAAAGWRIPEGSVGPEAMRARYSEGGLAGTQAEMQGTEPLTFHIESNAGLPWWGWTLIILLLLGAAGGTVYYLRQRGKA